MVKYSYNVWGKVSKTVISGCEQALAKFGGGAPNIDVTEKEMELLDFIDVIW